MKKEKKNYEIFGFGCFLISSAKLCLIMGINDDAIDDHGYTRLVEVVVGVIVVLHYFQSVKIHNNSALVWDERDLDSPWDFINNEEVLMYTQS